MPTMRRTRRGIILEDEAAGAYRVELAGGQVVETRLTSRPLPSSL